MRSKRWPFRLRSVTFTYRCGLCVACIVLLPFSLHAATTITIVNGDPAGVGFNDLTVVDPVGGNTGTTLGEQRLNVFTAAANIWSAVLTSTVPIRVHALWTALTCSENSAVLGSAGAAEVFRNFNNAPVAGHWYPKALANKLAGVELDPDNNDINANFNINLGNAGCLTGLFFYLGLDNNHGSDVDLYTVLLHELAHGLGFQTYTNGSTGALFLNFPSILDDFILDNTTDETWTHMTANERKTSATNTGNLVWNGPNVTGSVPYVLQLNGGTFTGADAQGRARLYAPSPYQSGSSVSHYDIVAIPNQIMEPAINSDLLHEVTAPTDLTLALLTDIGWTVGDSPAKRRGGQITSQDD